DVHADFGKDDQSHHHHEHDPQRVLGERQERSQALTAPLCRSALNRRLDVGGEDLPEEQRDDDDEADQEERREQASALFAAQPAERFHTPDFEDQQRCDDTKHAVQDPAEGGKIAVGTYFQEGVALPQFVVQVEDPVDQQPDEVRRRPRHREDQDGQERAVQEELETALDIQRPDDEAADDIGHGKNVPDFGEANPKIAQGRGGASAHQQIPHRLALLQDENHHHPGHDEAEEGQEQVIGAARETEHQGGAQEEVAVNPYPREPRQPHRGIGRCLVAHRQQPEPRLIGHQQHAPSQRDDPREQDRVDERQGHQARDLSRLNHGKKSKGYHRKG